MYLIEAVNRRKSYYISKFRSLRNRQQIIESYLRSARSRRLHLGCGGNLLEGWLNSDILDVKEGMIFIDVRERLPFENNIFDFLYSEHLVEHLTYSQGLDHLKECFRVLRKGGILRISTPNLAFLLDFYVNDSHENEEYLRWATDFYWQPSTYSKTLVVNRYVRSWGHKCIYDFQLLRDTCEKAGFRQVKKEAPGVSHFAFLRRVEQHGRIISDRWNNKESLVIEAKK